MTDDDEKAEAAALARGMDRKTGFATDGTWPVNARLRAEAMVKEGVRTDPDGIITDDLIDDTADRLAREAKAEDEEARKAPSLRWSKADLVAEAQRLEIPVEPDADKPAILGAITAAQPAGNTEA